MQNDILQKLDYMLSLLKQSSTSKKLPIYVDTPTLQQEVIQISPDFLASRITNGELQLGKHYLIVSDGNSKRQEKRWHWRKLLELYGTHPAARKPSKSRKSRASNSPDSFAPPSSPSSENECSASD